MTKKQLVAAIDLGGSNLRCAIGDLAASGYLTRRVVKTPAEVGPKRLIDHVYLEVMRSLDEAGLSRQALASVGCAAPGITDPESGVVVGAANLRGWQDVPLASLLEKRFGVAAAIENDVKAAALGEFKYGAGSGTRSLVYLTISTGVSAGILIDGRVLRGHHHAAGEIAYLVPEPVHLGKDWGENGCLESTAAGVGIAREWTKQESSRADWSAADVFRAARAGSEQAQAIIERASNYLAQAAIALCAIINPEVLVLGGGIAEHEPELVDRISQAVSTTFPFPPQVRRAELGGDAPLMGALMLAVEKLNR